MFTKLTAHKIQKDMDKKVFVAQSNPFDLIKYMDILTCYPTCSTHLFATSYSQIALSVSQVSTNIIRKYSGLIDIWLSSWSAHNSMNGQMHCLLNENPHRSYVAMSQHLSQWVWYVSFTRTLNMHN